MAFVSHSRSGSCVVFAKHYLVPIFDSCSQLSSSRRQFCSNQNETTCDDDEMDKDDKSSTKSKTAKAMARLINYKPWSNELASSLFTLSPSLSKTMVLQTLRLITNSSKAFQFFKWVHDLGFPHKDQTYFMMLEILGRGRNLNAARNFLFSIELRSNGAVKLNDRFFNSLIRSYGQARLFDESMKLFQTMKTMGVSPSVITFNNIFSILLRRGRTNMANDLYYEMLSTYGVTPDTYTYNILIRGFCKNSMVDQGFRFFNEMSRFNCDPDIVTYNTLVDGLCKAGKVKIAHNLVKGMSKKCKDLNPNVVTYTTLIRGYCMKQELDKALLIIKEMTSQGLKLNQITYNTLIKGLCEARKLDKIKDILEQTIEDGEFSPDTCTFNTLIHAHCSSGNLDEALKVFERMKNMQVPADSATYGVLLRSLCQREDYDMAEKLFDELYETEILLSNFGSKPLAASYNPMFQYLCEHGKTKKAERVFRQLMKRGTQDPPSYKTMIMGHCKEGSYENGYELLKWMLRQNFLPDVEIYNSLIDGFLQKEKPLLAKEALEKMLRSSYLPQTLTWHSILAKLLEKGCTHESAGFIVMMLDNNVRQNIKFSSMSLQLLFGRGLKDKAFEILEFLYKHGYCVKIDELVQFLIHRGKLSEASKMLAFCFDNDQNVDLDLCNAVILGLCKWNKVSEAFGLCYVLVEKGLHQELTCLDELVSALEVEGRSDEAAFISKRMQKQELLGRSSQK
ncbi:hypothetical protein QN277_023531 [Acacia crassicarpa]|uniref:Pentatricopeptide repeat-containing protein n=1 Tax=Acacia crassicarpa TaxID=499986 RepID=A0AAE1MJW5_9FABA|nr:hypothetical protein QN277_023531 [Acacia crassicarpa]